MKRAFFFVVPFALALMLSSAVRADDKEQTINVTVGCAHCNFEAATGAPSCGAAAKTADGKVLLLKGDAVKGLEFKKGGDYTVVGKVSDDGKSIEVTTIKPKA